MELVHFQLTGLLGLVSGPDVNLLGVKRLLTVARLRLSLSVQLAYVCHWPAGGVEPCSFVDDIGDGQLSKLHPGDSSEKQVRCKPVTALERNAQQTGGQGDKKCSVVRQFRRH